MVFTSRNSHQSGADEELSTFRRALPQFIAVGVKNVVLFGYGMTLGFPTIVIPAIKGGDGRENSTEGDFILNADQISWLSSINLLCVPLGCFFSGALTEPTGKRRAMQLVNFPMFISWLLFYFSTNVNFLYAGLCLSGVSGGLMEAPVLTYVAEVTQPQFRGMLAATGTTCVITGIFVQFILGKFLAWRLVALVSCFLPILTIIALFFVPESPYWLLTKGHVDEAKKSLAWLRGWVPFEKVAQEFEEIHNVLSVRRREVEAAKLKPFYKRIEPFLGRGFIVPFILVSSTFFIGHFSGKTPLQTYAVQIFSTLKAPIDKYYATILLGAAELVGAFSCVLLVHITGKRPLVFVSLIGTGICFFGAATYAWYLDSVPGFIVENVVANYSIPDHLQRKNFINQQNINFDAMMSNGSETEITTDLLVSITTETTYLDLENETTTNSIEAKKIFHFKPDTYQTNATNRTDLSKFFLSIPNAEENKYLWLPLALLLTGSFFAHLGIRIIPWMLIGEVFPVNVRSSASGLSSGIGYIFAFLSNKVFLQMLATLTLPGTFWFYSAVAIIGCLILYFLLPETENRKLIDIEAHFLGKRSLSDQTNTKNESAINNNTVDLVNTLPRMIGSKYPDNDGTLKEVGDEDVANGIQSHRLGVPEVIINLERTPNAGSKRYKNRVSDTIRSRNSLTSNDDDVQDTRL